jgi:hypothetical protein
MVCSRGAGASGAPSLGAVRRRLTPALGIMSYVLVVIGIIVGWILLREMRGRLWGFDEISWRGQTFKLSRRYLDYEQFKKARNQIRPTEAERIMEFMLSIEVPQFTSTWKELVHALSEMRFPGYGSTTNGAVRDRDGNSYVLFEYEIPGRDKMRALLYRKTDSGSYQLLFDGLSAGHPNDHKLSGTRDTIVEDGKIVHYRNGVAYRETLLSSSS